MRETVERAGCLTVILRILGISLSNPDTVQSLPYRLRDDFLSPAERSFFGVLQLAVASQAVVFAKVRVADLLYVPRGEGRQSHQNRISAKHVDFVLCDPDSLQPIAAIELDDASHSREDRMERDEFLDSAFAAANLPLVRLPAQRQYDVKSVAARIDELITPNKIESSRNPVSPASSGGKSCPKCGAEMVLRVANSGQNKGQQFFGCPNFPRCRGTLAAE